MTIQGFTPFGPVLAVRPYCHNDNYWQVYFNYWQVYFDTNMAIRELLGDSAFPGAAYPDDAPGPLRFSLNAPPRRCGLVPSAASLRRRLSKEAANT